MAAAIRAARLDKLDALRAAGIEPYPPRFVRDRTLGELRAEFDDLADGTETDTRVRVAGRLMLMREQGKLTFATIRDRDGEVQLFVSLKELGDERFAAVQRPRPRRLGRRRRHRHGHPQGRAVGAGRRLRAAVEGAATPARQVEGPERRRPALPPALRRPHGQPRRPAGARGARAGGQRAARRCSSSAASSRSRRPSSTRCRAAPPPDRSSRTTTRSTSTPTCASRSSCRSSACSSAGSTGSSRSGASSATRASTPATTPSSRCSRPTPPSTTTPT